MAVEIWGAERWSAGRMLTGLVPLAVGPAFFHRREGIEGGPRLSPELLIFGRGLIVTAFILTAIGFSLLASALEGTDGAAMARIGATVSLMATFLLIVGEASGFSARNELCAID